MSSPVAALRERFAWLGGRPKEPPEPEEPQMSHQEALEAVTQDMSALLQLPENFLKDPEIFLAAVKQDLIALEHAPDELCHDYDFMIAAAQIDIMALEYAAPSLLMDTHFMYHAVRLDWRALKYAGPDTLRDYSLFAKITAQNWRALEYAHVDLREKISLIEIGLEQSGLAIQFAAGDLRQDRNLAVRAIKKDWMALEHVSSRFQTDNELVFMAVQQSWQALKFVPRWHKVGYSVINEAVRQDWRAVDNCLGELHSEAQLTSLAGVNPRAIRHPVLQCCRAAVLAAVSQNGLVLQYLNDTLKVKGSDVPGQSIHEAQLEELAPGREADRDVVLLAVKSRPGALAYASPVLKRDPALVALSKEEKRDRNNSSCLPRVMQDPDDASPSGAFCSWHSTSSRSFGRPSNGLMFSEHQGILERLGRLLDRCISKDTLFEARRHGGPKDVPVAGDLLRILQKRWAHPYSRIFTQTPSCYGLRGGHPFYKPCGWARMAVRGDRNLIDDWAVAYHGTTVEKAIWILIDGLQRPQSLAEIAHGQAYSSTQNTIYVSPSIEYAGHPVYATLAQVGRCQWLQAVLQVRVRPDSFECRPGSLGNKYWAPDLRIDPNYPNMDNLEWLIEDEQDVQVVGVMLREIGRCTEPSIYGDAASRVTEGERGPEYEFTRLRCEQLREEGKLISRLTSL